MLSRSIVSLIALACSSCIVPVTGGDVEGRFNVLTGVRRVEDTRSEDAFDSVPSIGLALGWGAVESGPGIEVGFLVAQDDDDLLGSDAEIEVIEIFSGLRWDHTIGPWRPYAGLGLAYTAWEFESNGPLYLGDEDDATGGYAMVGVEVLVSDNASVGLRGRYFVGKELDIDDFDVDPDYSELLFTFGLRY